jgi:hypothetical protein
MIETVVPDVRTAIYASRNDKGKATMGWGENKSVRNPHMSQATSFTCQGGRPKNVESTKVQLTAPRFKNEIR